MIRLDKALSEHTILTRNELRRRIQGGAVSVNGEKVLRPESKIDPLKDSILLDGEPVYCVPIYLMMNKPAGVVSATEDARLRTVVDLVPPSLRRKNLFPAGRLDRDTEGFVLLTDDGAFAHRILSPKKHVPKTYWVKVTGRVDEGSAEIFAEGMVLEDGSACKPALLTVLESGEKSVARVVLYEGMYHQIKRMFSQIGCHVDYLFREKIGGLPLDPTLKPGECRVITPSERDLILKE